MRLVMISMKRSNILSIFLVAAVLLVAAPGGLAQGRKARGATVIEEAQPQAGASQSNTGSDLVRSAELYKSSLQDLLKVREEAVKKAAEQLARLKELYKDGIISRLELEQNEQALVELQAKVDEVRRKIDATDQLIAEASAEADASYPLVLNPSDSKVRKVAYFRYDGRGVWSLNHAAQIESFFLKTFGRRLPVSALGQSDLHNRWGYDHREAMDVGLHPDSAEGQALMAYLQSAGIPFMAFRRAVPGSATGPHIHIGRPSHRVK